MARAIYRINEFIGIDQSRDENALKSAMSPDACNMDTADGNLSVCCGCVRHIEAPIPGTGDIHAIRIFSTPDGEMFIAACAVNERSGSKNMPAIISGVPIMAGSIMPRFMFDHMESTAVSATPIAPINIIIILKNFIKRSPS